MVKFCGFYMSLLLALVPSISYGGFWGVKDYDECILDSMKGVTSDKAALLIKKSCREKFPEPTVDSKSEVLPILAQTKITGRASVADSGYFEADLYNGTEDWSVSIVKIAVVDKDTNKTRSYKAYTGYMGHKYPIKPLSTGSISFRLLDNPKNMSWSIIEVSGYRD